MVVYTIVDFEYFLSFIITFVSHSRLSYFSYVGMRFLRFSFFRIGYNLPDHTGSLQLQRSVHKTELVVLKEMHPDKPSWEIWSMLKLCVFLCLLLRQTDVIVALNL